MNELSEDFKLLNEFYESNCRRNDCFLKNIPLAIPLSPGMGTQAKDLSGLPEGGIFGLLKASEIIVVVTGGFYTEGMEELLKNKKISYLCITPNITRDTRASSTVYAELVAWTGETIRFVGYRACAGLHQCENY